MPTTHFVSRKFLRVNGLSLPWNIAGRRVRGVTSSRDGGVNAAMLGRSSNSVDSSEEVGSENGTGQWQRCGEGRREELAATGPEGVGRRDHERGRDDGDGSSEIRRLAPLNKEPSSPTLRQDMGVHFAWKDVERTHFQKAASRVGQEYQVDILPAAGSHTDTSNKEVSVDGGAL